MIVSPNQKRTRSAQYVALALYVVFLGFPLLWMLSVSLKGPRELVELHPSFIPENPTLENYRIALDDNELVQSAINSLKVAAGLGDRDDSHRRSPPPTSSRGGAGS